MIFGAEICEGNHHKNSVDLELTIVSLTFIGSDHSNANIFNMLRTECIEKKRAMSLNFIINCFRHHANLLLNE